MATRINNTIGTMLNNIRIPIKVPALCSTRLRRKHSPPETGFSPAPQIHLYLFSSWILITFSDCFKSTYSKRHRKFRFRPRINCRRKPWNTLKDFCVICTPKYHAGTSPVSPASRPMLRKQMSPPAPSRSCSCTAAVYPSPIPLSDIWRS